ncbi:hypothetical protein DR85_523 [Francisella tularensis]|nr:hypothetical protein DR85_523 [Francisella tularensis]
MSNKNSHHIAKILVDIVINKHEEGMTEFELSKFFNYR